MTDDFAIRAEGLSKRYRLGVGSIHQDSLRDLLTNRVRNLFNQSRVRAARSEFFALKDASFEVARGENVGIIGANGAGKSTLLKVLSRITEPTEGRALISGRVGTLLEVGTGFHQELTGRENIFLYGAILGMSRSEINSTFDAIVDFAEIEKFIDTPVKRYSSGMYVRLAFAVAAHLRPDILLLDEVLAVGDLAFQRKCMAFTRELQKRNATILCVSHNMFSIKTICDRVIYLKSGKIQYDGTADIGIERYEHDLQLGVVQWSDAKLDDWPILITDMELRGQDGIVKLLFDFNERLTILIKYRTREPIRSPSFMIAIVRTDGVGCNVYANDVDGCDLGVLDGAGELEIETAPLRLVADRYIVHVLVRHNISQDLLCAQIGRSFHVRHPLFDSRNYGVFHEFAKWHAPRSELPEKNRSLPD